MCVYPERLQIVCESILEVMFCFQECEHETAEVLKVHRSCRMASTTNTNGVSSALLGRMTNLLIRGAMLFSVGVFLALVLNLLQVQRNVTLFPPDVISSIFSSAWWVPPCCGTAAGV